MRIYATEDLIQPSPLHPAITPPPRPAPVPVVARNTREAVTARFSTKLEARAGVSFLAVIKLLEKGFIDERLNPRRTKDRLVVSFGPSLRYGQHRLAKTSPTEELSNIVRFP